MLQVSRDDSYLKFNSVMTLRHTRRRDKIYLKKLFYLRNFLNLLQHYRVYLSWKFRKRWKNAVDRKAIAWKQHFEWNSNFYQPKTTATVFFRYFKCQLAMTSVIKSPRLFWFDIDEAKDNEKCFHVNFGREMLRKNLMIVCEREEDYFDMIFRKISWKLCNQFFCGI
jgi:hypothetical protein